MLATQAGGLEVDYQHSLSKMGEITPALWGLETQ